MPEEKLLGSLRGGVGWGFGLMHARQGDIRREWCICHLQPSEEKVRSLNETRGIDSLRMFVMAELFVQAGQFGFVASGLLPKRVGRAHLGSSRRGEAVRRGGAVRRVGILQRRGGGGVLQHRGGGQVLQHRGGAVRVRRVGALAEESRKSSSRFVATWGSCSSRWWRSSSTSSCRSSSTSRWWTSSSASRRGSSGSSRQGSCRRE